MTSFVSNILCSDLFLLKLINQTLFYIPCIFTQVFQIYYNIKRYTISILTVFLKAMCFSVFEGHVF